MIDTRDDRHTFMMKNIHRQINIHIHIQIDIHTHRQINIHMHIVRLTVTFCLHMSIVNMLKINLLWIMVLLYAMSYKH